MKRLLERTIADKSKRMANFHRLTVGNLTELLGAYGINNLDELQPSHINQRVNGTQVSNYAELYPEISPGCLLSNNNDPESWKADWEKAPADKW